MVVFPAASNPTINILISFLPNKLLNKLWKAPIFKSNRLPSKLKPEINKQLPKNETHNLYNYNTAPEMN